MKKISIVINILLIATLFYILNLKYYDPMIDKEEKIITLVERVIKEQGGF